MLLKLVSSTSTLRYQALYGENAAHHLILSSPAPRIFSVKLHRIPFNLCQHSNDVSAIVLPHTTTEWHTCSLHFVLFCCFSPYLYVCMFFLFFATTSLVNKDLYIRGLFFTSEGTETVWRPGFAGTY